ncbi:VOC family protein [Williamsia sp.]|uniref:VOC family protein n=1 Tax=Williamsia sp. TaxID=1872085 RepID=UPI001A27CA33|nr:VOC family protein [Williamsia sp.]MBJ7289987.1 VOC family protein [Williamsia sp.]
MATATISSALLSSDNPERLRDWYARVFDASIERTPGEPGHDPGEPVYFTVDLDGFYLMIDSRPDVRGPAAEAARLIVNAEVDCAQTTAARVDELGYGWLSALERRDAGWFGTALDPDGNYVQLIGFDEEMQREASEASMTPFSGFAVRDVDAAAAFYSDVLGLRVDRNPMGLLALHLDRRTRVVMYPKDDHVPASFTVLNIPVADIDAAIDDLEAKGVRLLRYDGLPCDDRGVLRGRSAQMGPDIAWFTDPSGNVISVMH